MPPNIGITPPARLSGPPAGQVLKLEGPSEPNFAASNAADGEGLLIARSVAVQQGTAVVGGPASIGVSKSWQADIDAIGLQAGPAAVTGVEVYAFGGRDAPTILSFTWSQDITIESG